MNRLNLENDYPSIHGTEQFELRVEKFKEAMLKTGSLAGLVSQASVKPGGLGDASFAPIDPAIVEAAKIVRAELHSRYGKARLVEMIAAEKKLRAWLDLPNFYISLALAIEIMNSLETE